MLDERTAEELIEMARLQVPKRFHFGHRAMPARLGKQRHVIAAALVAVGPAQVDDARRRILGVRGIGQVFARGHDTRAVDVERPVAGMVDDDEDVHRRSAPWRGYTTSRFASCVTMPSRIAASTRSTLIQYSCDVPYGVG